MGYTSYIMTEFTERAIAPAYSQDDLREVVTHPNYQIIEPNFASPSTLLLRELELSQIERVVEALGTGSPLTRIERGLNPPKPSLVIDGLGTLSYVDRGESRWCYLLTTQDEKKMAITTGGYHISLGFPPDSRVNLYTRDSARTTLVYSDMRVHLLLPINLLVRGDQYPSSLAFQEWGGDESLKDPRDPRINAAAERVRRHINNRGGIVTQDTDRELAHPRHYLLNQGPDCPPAVIDINFIRENR